MENKYKSMLPINSNDPIVSDFVRLANGAFHLKEIGFPPTKMDSYFIEFFPEVNGDCGITFYLGDKYSLDYLKFSNGSDLFILWEEK